MKTRRMQKLKFVSGIRLADKPVYGNQPLADRIYSKEKTFKNHGAK